jgi:putative DNA primase/helicase
MKRRLGDLKLNTEFIHNVPEKLKAKKQWVCWKAVPKENRVTKVPVNPSNKIAMNINESHKWLSFDEAVKACVKHNLTGIGFVFTSSDPFVGIDIDHCVDSEGNLSEFASGIVKQLNSYTEYSPSKTGLHIICEGILPIGKNKNTELGLEMYDSKRYLTFTGNRVSGLEDVEKRTAEVINVSNQFLAVNSKQTTSTGKSYATSRQTINDDKPDALKIMSNMKNGQRAMDLYKANWQGYYSSQNEADLSFCNALAFATDKNSHEMDDIFRNSGLYRQKWDDKHSSNGKTYGDLTIEKAIQGCSRTFKPLTLVDQPKTNYEQVDTLPSWYVVDKRNDRVKFLPGVLVEHLLKTQYIRFIKGQFHLYSNGVYAEMEEIDVKSLIQKQLITVHLKASHVKEVMELWRTSLSQFEGIDEVKAEYIMNFQNGLYNIKTEELMQHTPDYVSVIQLNCYYSKSSECSQFHSYLNNALEPELIPIIQEIMGYLLLPITKSQKAFILYGPGRTGKSTFLRILEKIIGQENISNLALQKLDDRFSTSYLFGKLLNSNGDLPMMAVKDTSIFKMITGEDIIQAEWKNGSHFSFKNKARLIFSCNQLPQNDMDRSDGFYRRLLIIPFLKQVAVDDVDPYLIDKLLTEVDGILQWALQGLQRLIRNHFKFTDSAITEQMLKGYQFGNESVKWFVENYCEVIVDEQIYSQHLYEAYKSACYANKMQLKTQIKFNSDIIQICENAVIKGNEPKTKKAIFKGVRLREDISKAV